MIKLLRKELSLTASPLSYFFIAFATMTMIPGYPILVGSFFICLGIFYSFQSGREANDTLYTALLPVRKRDVVASKFAFTVGIELIALTLNCVMTVVRMTLLRDAAPYVSNPLMNANPAYLGYVLIIFALFNLVFLTGFFKTSYYFGKPFVLFSVASFVAIGFAETLHFLPGLGDLNATGLRVLQLPVLAAGVIAYLLLTVISYRVSARRFERIDL